MPEPEPVPSEVYTTEYFLSDACEGFDEYRTGGVSALKRLEIELLDARPAMRVLDLGCGRGEVVAELRRRGVAAVGADYAAAAVGLGRELLGPGPPLVRADAAALPFRDAVFERVLMGDVVEHLTPEVAAAALAEVRRVMPPGGELLVHTSPNRWFARLVLPALRLWLGAFGPSSLAERLRNYEQRKRVMHPNELSPLGLRRLLRRGGWRARVWVSGDVLRSGSGPWTADLARRRLVRAAGRAAGVWPLRLVLGNDLFARARPAPGPVAGVTACPLCGGRQGRVIFARFRPPPAPPTGRPTEDLYGRAGRLLRCMGCGLVRQDPPPDADYEEAEDPDYLEELEGLRRTFARTLETVARYRPPPGRLLDVGCGPGVLVEEAARRGWEAIGLELSRWAVERARARGLDVRAERIEDLDLPPCSVDVAVLSDVIEHVEDPLGLLCRLHELLRVGGVLFVSTPDVESLAARLLRRWWWSVLPGHRWLFSRSTLERAVIRAGFEVLEVSTHPKTFSARYYAGRLGGYVGVLRRAARALAPTRLVTLDLKDRVALVARKP